MTRLLMGLALLFTLLVNDSYGQRRCAPPTIATTVAAGPQFGSNARHTPFSINGPTACAHVFYLFGDGHYSFQRNPVHEYRAPGTYTPEIYALEAYDVSVPGKLGLTSGGPSINLNQTPASPMQVPVSSTARPFFPGPVHLSQSWRAADGNEMIYIVSVKHPAGPHNATADGSVTLELDPRIDVDPNSLTGLSIPPQDWGSSPTYIPKRPGAGDKLVWQFGDLEIGPNHARHFYVKVNIPSGLLKQELISTVTAEYVGMTVSTDLLRSEVFTYPHDPNTIEVNKECVQGNIGDGQILEYTVNFQNEGNGFANNVQVEVNTSWQLFPESVTVLASSADMAGVEIDPITNKIYFTFPDINLPGTKQIVPNSFCPDLTTGYVKFSICTDVVLPPGGWGDPQAEVMAEAFIYFDNQPAIWTGPSTLLTTDFCTKYDLCRASQNLVLSSAPTISPADNLLEKQLQPSVNVYPNPTSSRVNIEYSVLQEGATVEVNLHSVSGQQQATILLERFQAKGDYDVSYDLSSFPAGIYMIEVRSGDHRELRRLVKME